MSSHIFKSFPDCSDEELMIFLCQGKKAAFDELYGRYSRKMLFFFLQRLNQDNEKAHDFLQELFLKVFEKASSFNERQKFSSWLYTIAANMCKNEYRQLEKRKTDLVDFDELEIEAKNEMLIEKDETIHFQNCLNQVLGTLDEKKSLTFILRHEEQLSVKEISEIMKCPEGTVKSRLFYVIKKLSVSLRKFNLMTAL